jgi:hypothetical protein
MVDGTYGIKDTYVVCKYVKKTLLELGFNLPGLSSREREVSERADRCRTSDRWEILLFL